VNYWDGGTIVDTANTLVSILGTYNMKAKMCYFKKDVKLTAPKYTVRCDTMNYEPELRKAYFFGPTHITSKNNYMYCVKGYYSTKTNISQFSNGAYIINKKGSRLSGNQLYYDRGKDRGQVMDNVSLWDSANNVTITGEYADYKGDDRTILVTCHALMDQVYDKDTLHLHADTLFGNNISVEDSAGSKDSGKILLAFHHVKFFKKDLQGKCDSLTYDEKDSIMNMYHSPVLWSDENQLTADTMHMLMKNKKMNVLLMNNNSFIASLDTIAKQLAGEDKIKADSAKKDTGTHKIDTVKSSAKDSGHVSLVHDSVHISHVKDSGNVSFAKDSGHISSVHDSVQASSIQDSDQYNQIKGKNMKGFFRDNKMYKVLVKGNAQTIYYPYSDNNTTAVGSNRAECSNMLIFIEKNKIKSITFLQKPDATLYPMKDIKKSEFFLGGFKWRDNERPHKVEDIFN
jgi:lipopolysaccharide export system protein LptA